MDQLLWELLQVGALSHLPAAQPLLGEMGTAEIPALQASTQSHSLAAAHCAAGSVAVCPLASWCLAVRRLGDWSRMSGDVHVRFSEGVGVRFPRATRLVVVCRYRYEAEQALQAIRQILKKLKLTLHPAKTRIVRLPQEGFDFLGFHFLKFRSQVSGKLAPYAWPPKKAMTKSRGRIRQLTKSCWLRARPAEIVGLLNPVIRGWRNYHAGSNASRHFQKLDFYVQLRLRQMYRRRQHGWRPGTHAGCLRWLRLFLVERFSKSGICGLGLECAR